MKIYIFRRLIQTVIMLLLLSYFCFTLMALMPGDPVDLMIQSNPKMTSEDVIRLKDAPSHFGRKPHSSNYLKWD